MFSGGLSKAEPVGELAGGDSLATSLAEEHAARSTAIAKQDFDMAHEPSSFSNWNKPPIELADDVISDGQFCECTGPFG